MVDSPLFSYCEQGYNAREVDEYINLLQNEYLNTVKTNEELSENVCKFTDAYSDLSAELAVLKAKNKELYRDCVALAKYIKSHDMTKSKDKQPAKTTELFSVLKTLCVSLIDVIESTINDKDV